MRFASLIPQSGEILDLACGSGRHSRLALGLGYRVVAADCSILGLEDLRKQKSLEIVEIDLETANPFVPGGILHGRIFTGIIVTNYLHRLILSSLIGALADDGVLIYETFSVGNERYGHPRNPDYLLRPGELLETARKRLQVIAYENGLIQEPRMAVVQRLCAVNSSPDSLATNPPSIAPL
jgi:SAM-dependent methyltransferase